MGSLSLASILANGCRSPSSRLALLRTLATTHAALSKHYNKHVVACSSGCSQSKLSACESSSPDVTHNAPVEVYVLFHIFIAYMLLRACNIGWLAMGCHKFCLHFGWLLIKLRKNTWIWTFQCYYFVVSLLLLMGSSNFPSLLLLVRWVSVITVIWLVS